MNFPNATADQWTAAQRMIRGLCRRHGVYGPDADDAVQAWTADTLTTDYRQTCPVSPTAAAAGARYRVARYGIGALTRSLRAGRYRPQARQRVGLEQPQPDRDPLPVVTTAPAAVDPATAVEIAEGYSPARVKAARRAGMTPARFALAALGWGPLDDEEAAKSSPSVPQCGPGYTPPATGCPGMATATDPNPATRVAADRRCREHLDALAAGSLQPRTQEQTAEPTAAEQAEQARQAWLSFKRKGRRIDAWHEDPTPCRPRRIVR